jgi:hypothetical protein
LFTKRSSGSSFLERDGFDTGFTGQEVFFLKSQTMGVGWQQSIGTTSLLLTTLDVTNQELSFNPGNYVTMYSFSIGFRTRF